MVNSFGPGRNIKTVSTYWAPQDSTSGFAGELEFATPVLVRGFWSESSQITRNSQGDEVVYHSAVFLDTEVQEDGYLIEGDYVTAGGHADPLSVAGARQIKAFSAYNDLRSMSKERVAYV